MMIYTKPYSIYLYVYICIYIDICVFMCLYMYVRVKSTPEALHQNGFEALAASSRSARRAHHQM